MAYYTKVLQPDETVKFVGKLHWTIYRQAIFFGILTLIVAGFALNLSGDRRLLPLAGAGLLALLTIVSFVRAWFRRVTTEIVVTDKRVISKTGWISRRTEEMNISKVETVEIRQGLMGRMFNYGTVWIRGIGSTWDPLPAVAEPIELRNAIVVG